MLKVLIADDEEKICQLIERLIDWKALDMEVVATASDGISALEQITATKPDIAITDIRMPGYDGLELIRRAKEVDETIEFIIISGYRHFEYAQSAIKYGVSDYLLKPIKKDELTATLLKIRKQHDAMNEQSLMDEQSIGSRKSDEGLLREVFISKILLRDKGDIRSEHIDDINSEYHYRFRDGIYGMAIIKLDGNILSEEKNRDFIIDRTMGIVDNLFKGLLYDYETYIEDTCIYMLTNYDPNSKKEVRRKYKTLLDELIVQAGILEGLRATIALGGVSEHISDIVDSCTSAKRMQEERLISGTGRIYDAETAPMAKQGWVHSDEFSQFNKDMNKALESLNVSSVRDTLLALKSHMLSSKDITGHEILQMTREACNLYLYFMRNHKIHIEDGFLEIYNKEAENCASATELMDYLIRSITVSYDRATIEKKQEDNRPVRIAKQYIEEHYAQPITLDEVSEAAQLSPTYFSSVFKRETGMTFLEYLSDIRMEMAKKLLKETNNPIPAICESVGYSDVKYFTKTFTRFSGLKPGEYRKLYS